MAKSNRFKFVHTGRLEGQPAYDVFLRGLGYLGTVWRTADGIWRARGRMEHTRGSGKTKQDAVADVLDQEREWIT